MIEVRDLTEDDIEAGIDLGEQMHQESEFRSLDYDREKLRGFALSLIADPHRLALVADDNGEIIGMVFAYVAEHYFSRDLLAKDTLFYVRKDRRGGRTALLLMNAYQEWAQDYPKPVKAIVMEVSTGGKNMADSDKFFPHWGMELIGGTYRRLL